MLRAERRTGINTPFPGRLSSNRHLNVTERPNGDQGARFPTRFPGDFPDLLCKKDIPGFAEHIPGFEGRSFTRANTWSVLNRCSSNSVVQKFEKMPPR